jgi:hypothetical protein
MMKQNLKKRPMPKQEQPSHKDILTSPELNTHEQGASLEFREPSAMKIARSDLTERCGG